ncbi:MAG: SRPBCC family protein [Bryobacteraceae bacterium]
MWKLKLDKLTPLAPMSCVVSAGPPTVYDILTDYDSYLDWFPLATHSKLLVKEGDGLAIAEFGFERPKDAKLTMECIHTRNEMVLLRRISGNVPLLRSQWNLAPEGSGTRVTLKNVMDFSNWRMFVPGGAHRFVMSHLLNALSERVNAFSSEFGAGEGRKFLEIVQTNDYLEVWFLGRKYKLTPVDE